MLSFESSVDGLDNSPIIPPFTKTFCIFSHFLPHINHSLKWYQKQWGLIFILEDSFLEQTQPTNCPPGDVSSCSSCFKAESCCWQCGPRALPGLHSWVLEGFGIFYAQNCTLISSSSGFSPAKFSLFASLSVCILIFQATKSSTFFLLSCICGWKCVQKVTRKSQLNSNSPSRIESFLFVTCFSLWPRSFPHWYVV